LVVEFVPDTLLRRGNLSPLFSIRLQYSFRTIFFLGAGWFGDRSPLPYSPSVGHPVGGRFEHVLISPCPEDPSVKRFVSPFPPIKVAADSWISCRSPFPVKTGPVPLQAFQCPLPPPLALYGKNLIFFSHTLQKPPPFNPWGVRRRTNDPRLSP